MIDFSSAGDNAEGDAALRDAARRALQIDSHFPPSPPPPENAAAEQAPSPSPPEKHAHRKTRGTNRYERRRRTRRHIWGGLVWQGGRADQNRARSADMRSLTLIALTCVPDSAPLQPIVMGRASKDKRDIYYRRAKELGYRARSAFKLIQIDRQFNILQGAKCVVDLCAAPGGWTEVLCERITARETTEEENKEEQAPSSVPAAAASASASCAPPAASSFSPRIVAVDLQAMSPLPGVHFIQGDLTRAATAQMILQSLSDCETGEPRRADLVVCDGAPDVIGLVDLDEAVQHSLTLCALTVAVQILRPGSGAFVAKLFRGRHLPRMLRVCRRYFETVAVAKPKASRNASIEGFVVCREFRGMEAIGQAHRDWEADPVSMDEVASDEQAEAEGTEEQTEFVSCWDEERLDSDKSYPLSFCFKGKPNSLAAGATMEDAAALSPSSVGGSYHPLAPSALPIDPPYMRSVRMKKEQAKMHKHA